MACEIAGIEPAVVVFESDDPRAYIIASNIARRHMSKGQQAMAVAMVYPEPEKTTHGKKSKTKLLLETKTNFSGARLSQARTVLACSTDLARAVLAGTKALDAAYGEAKKAKQQLDGKGVAKSQRAANMRLRNRKRRHMTKSQQVMARPSTASPSFIISANLLRRGAWRPMELTNPTSSAAPRPMSMASSMVTSRVACRSNLRLSSSW